MVRSIPVVQHVGQFKRQGVVKSWNGAKGFGFISAGSLTGDIMFSRQELPEDHREVRGKFLEGKPVSFRSQTSSDDRLKVTTMEVSVVEGQQTAGRIKSHSERNGYGFISSSSLSDDVRFVSTDISGFVYGLKLQGELVIFEMITLPDGKLRATKIMFQSSKIATRLKGEGALTATVGFAAAGGLATMSGAGLVASMASLGATGLPKGMGKGSGNGFGGKGFARNALGNGAPNGSGADAVGSMGTHVGYVKSFSEKNGYGFINIPGQLFDIKFGQSDLQAGTVVGQGSVVQFSMDPGPDGRPQARQVMLTADAPAGEARGQKRHATMALGHGGAGVAELAMNHFKTESTTGQERSGTIKSYNSSKGFGFINTPNIVGDVFFMRTALPETMRESHGKELTGRGVSFEVLQCSDGQMRAGNIVVS